jgi:aspartate kinase
VQNVAGSELADISFTVPRTELNRTRATIDKLMPALGGTSASYDVDIAMISIVGVGMRSHSGVAYRMFEVLGAHRINVEMISTSEIKISVVIRSAYADEAMRLLHEAFELEKLDLPAGG